MLCQVEDRLSRRTWHDELLASGILGVLKAWIEPMPDGNLPNIKVGVPWQALSAQRPAQFGPVSMRPCSLPVALVVKGLATDALR